MKNISKKRVLTIVALVTFLTLLMASGVFAANKVEAFVTDLTKNIRSIAIFFIALAATITAVLYMLGAANPKMKSLSKDALYALIVGVIILVLSGNIADFVSNIVVDKDISDISSSDSDPDSDSDGDEDTPY